MMQDHLNTARTNFYEADFMDPLKSRRATNNEDDRQVRSCDRLPEVLSGKSRVAMKSGGGSGAHKQQRNGRRRSLETGGFGGAEPMKGSKRSLNNSSHAGT